MPERRSRPLGQTAGRSEDEKGGNQHQRHAEQQRQPCQTLVDSADGFRRAEKEAQDRLFKDLSLTLKDKFLENYRRIRKQFHDRSDFSINPSGPKFTITIA